LILVTDFGGLDVLLLSQRTFYKLVFEVLGSGVAGGGEKDVSLCAGFACQQAKRVRK
jgi:hypothetical protein